MFALRGILAQTQNDYVLVGHTPFGNVAHVKKCLFTNEIRQTLFAAAAPWTVYLRTNGLF